MKHKGGARPVDLGCLQVFRDVYYIRQKCLYISSSTHRYIMYICVHILLYT